MNPVEILCAVLLKSSATTHLLRIPYELLFRKQKQCVDRKKLQLVGVTSMLIASKYEEMYAPEIGDFEYITDHAYTSTEIRRMECLILKTLNFNLGRPLPLHFLRRNSKAGEASLCMLHHPLLFSVFLFFCFPPRSALTCSELSHYSR